MSTHNTLIDPNLIAKGFADKNLTPTRDQQLMFQALLYGNAAVRDANKGIGFNPILHNLGQRTGKSTLCEVVVWSHPRAMMIVSHDFMASRLKIQYPNHKSQFRTPDDAFIGDADEFDIFLFDVDCAHRGMPSTFKNHDFRALMQSGKILVWVG